MSYLEKWLNSTKIFLLSSWSFATPRITSSEPSFPQPSDQASTSLALATAAFCGNSSVWKEMAMKLRRSKYQVFRILNQLKKFQRVAPLLLDRCQSFLCERSQGRACYRLRNRGQWVVVGWWVNRVWDKNTILSVQLIWTKAAPKNARLSTMSLLSTRTKTLSSNSLKHSDSECRNNLSSDEEKSWFLLCLFIMHHCMK